MLFNYPCIVVDRTVNSLYRIKVFSLPLAPGNHSNSEEHAVYVPSTEDGEDLFAILG